MKTQTIDTVDEVVTAPADAKTVRTRNHQPVKDGKENSALDIELEPAPCQHPIDGGLDAGFFPQSFKDQHRTDLLCFSGDIALA
jgi:hypothetical protein